MGEEEQLKKALQVAKAFERKMWRTVLEAEELFLSAANSTTLAEFNLEKFNKKLNKAGEE
mgnify:CR=1 FL=1